MGTLVDWLQRCRRRHGGKRALIAGDAAVTYAELADRAARVAGLWRGLGLAPGDRVAFLSPNALEHAELVFGGAHAGVTTVLLNYRLTARELAPIVAHARARVLVAAERCRALVDGIVAAGFDGRVLFLGTSYDDARSRAAPIAPVAAPGAVLQLYTSGTTGVPKGVCLSEKNLASFAWTNEAEGSVRVDDVHLTAAPLCFAAAAARLCMNIHIGATSLLLSDFDAAAIHRLAASGDVTTMMVVPAMMRLLVEAPERPAPSPRLRLVMYGGSPMPRPVVEAAMAHFAGAGFYQGYGLTETLTLTTLKPEDHRGERLSSVGRAAVGVDVRVVDDAGNDVGPGAVGEIIAKSDAVMDGYFEDQAATADVVRNGWAHTGDLATVDDDGFVFIVDRKKDMLISGGINVYPREVELALLEHPAVADVAVVGRADARWGEVPVAFVVPRGDPHALGAQLGTDLRAHVADRLAKFKQPKDYVVVDALPKNAVGKVLKQELKKRLTS